MNLKVVALAIVAVILISGTFYYLKVDYPFGIEIKPPVTQASIFAKTIVPTDSLGFGTANATKLTLGSKTYTTVEGYVYNASSHQAITNSVLYAAAYPDETSSSTSVSGFYSFGVVYAVSGTFAFKIPGFAKQFKSESWNGGTVWLNLSFQPAVKHLISGTTYYHNGTIFPSASMVLIGSYSTLSVVSNSNGKFQLSVYNDSYNVTTLMKGFMPYVEPYWLNVTGPISDNFIFLDSGKLFNVSGFLHATNGTALKGGQVSFFSTVVTTDSKGAYTIGVPYGRDTLYGSMKGYQPNDTIISVNRTLTDVNITLTIGNPFLVGGGGGSTGTGAGGGNGTNISSSNVSASSYGSYLISGILINNFQKQPIQNVSFEILMNVSGSLFYKYEKTNLSGEYAFSVSFQGTYNLYFEVPGYLRNNTSVVVSSSLTHLKTILTPNPLKSITISGNVTNALTGGAISGASILVENPSLKVFSSLAFTNAGGYYRITMPLDVYAVNASKPGFLSKVMEKNFTGNITLNFSLMPGGTYFHNTTGNISWNTSASGIPGISNASILSNLSNGVTVNSANESIILTLVNNAGGVLPYLDYAFYTEINGLYFRIVNETNSTGMSVIDLAYNASITFVVDALQFQSGKNTAAYGSYRQKVTMNPVYTYSGSETVSNRFNLTHSLTNLSVPKSALILVNSIVQPYNRSSYFAVSQSSAGTLFSYLLGNASYIFAYTNAGYVLNSSTLKVSGASGVTLKMLVNPYMFIISTNVSKAITVNVTSSANGNVIFSTGISAGKSVSYLGPFYSSSFKLLFYLQGSGTVLNASSPITLSTSSPVNTSYFNLTSGNFSLSLLSASISGGTIAMSYSGTAPGNFVVYAFNISYAISNSSSVTLDGLALSILGIADVGGYYTVSITETHVTATGTTTLDVTTSSTGASIPSVTNLYYYSSELS
ncbi:MAG: carboxypeptidase-like regulatory domain-containing protein [Thermoplasmataceae archaeon]